MRYRYSYEKNKKHLCPSCNKKTFVRFIDNVTSEYLPDEYGRCDREGNCTYMLHPVNDGYAKHMFEQERGEVVERPPKRPTVQTQAIRPKIYIPNELVAKSKTGYNENIFVLNLLKTIPKNIVADGVKRYQIGTSNRWEGATIFWFIDYLNRIVAGQTKLFDQTNHTAKFLNKENEKQSCTTYVTATMKYNHEKKGEAVPQWLVDYHNQDDKVTALFGEHLLNVYPNKIIAIFEAPKTAVIASFYFPQFLCMAVGGLSYLTIERVKVLKGRNVVLFPDIGKVIEGKKTAFEKWTDKAKAFAHIAKFKVSDYLEKIATDEERNEGLDLADWLLKLDYIEFTTGVTTPKTQPLPKSEPLPEIKLITAVLLPLGNIEPIEAIKPIQQQEEPPPIIDYVANAVAHYKKLYSTKNMPPDKYFLSYGISIKNLLKGQTAQCFTDAALLQLTNQH